MVCSSVGARLEHEESYTAQLLMPGRTLACGDTYFDAISQMLPPGEQTWEVVPRLNRFTSLACNLRRLCALPHVACCTASIQEQHCGGCWPSLLSSDVLQCLCRPARPWSCVLSHRQCVGLPEELFSALYNSCQSSAPPGLPAGVTGIMRHVYKDLQAEQHRLSKQMHSFHA